MERLPILEIGDVLLVSIQVDLEDRTATALQEDLCDRITATGARGVIIDISALEIVDSFIGRVLASTAAASRVLDAETVVVGMRPAVAITLVELGLSLGSARTALDLEKGMAALHRGGVGVAIGTGEVREAEPGRGARSGGATAATGGDEGVVGR